MVESKLLRVLYTIFLGALIATAIGVGINAFYEGPKMPQYGVSDDLMMSKNGELTDEQRARAKAIDADQRAFEEKNKVYSRNVSIILLVLAVGLVAASIFTEMKSMVFSDGIMIGGLITLVHSIIRGAIAGNKQYLFIATIVSLIVIAYLGYRRFVHRTPRTPLV